MEIKPRSCPKGPVIKMRLHEIAKKLGMPVKELMSVLRTLKISASSHMSALSEEEARIVFDHFKVKPKTEEKAKAPLGKSLKEKNTPVGPSFKIKPPLSKEKMDLPERLKASSKAMPPPPALTVPQGAKKFILVKKKKELEAAPLPSSSTTETLLSPLETHPIAVPEIVSTTPVKSEPAAESLPLEESLSPDSSEALPPVLSITPEKAPAVLQNVQEPLKAPPLSTPHVASEEKTDKEKSEVVALDTVKHDPRKGFRNRLQEKWKKSAPLTLVESSQVLTEEPAGPARKWQDFRPTHKKQAQKILQKQSPVVDITKPRRKIIKINEGLTVKEFSALVGTKVSILISKLMGLGKMITANQLMSMEDAFFLSEELGIKVELVSESTEEEVLRPTPASDTTEQLVPRPPVITIMGHVDHGKTSLLDAIRKAKVCEGESGGITQHIGAYTVSVHGHAITFLDTPGHEAFTAMRARGAKITDIVVLVVAADDGVMPQTIEAIHHAQAANVPILVAINKMDTPDANPERIKTALTEYGLVAEAWGGKTLFVEVSAKQKMGLEHFLEMILLQADVLELKGNPHTRMEGVIIEAKLSRGRGPVATVLVQQGTLRVGDAFVAGVQAGRVRALVNDVGEQVKEASLSMPVEVIGFSGVPSAGDTFLFAEDERVAKDVAQERLHRQRILALAHNTPRVTLHNLSQHIQEGDVEELRLVIKADVHGSVGALSDSIEKLSTEMVKVRILHKGVGGITESDVLLASASNAIIIGFHVRPDPTAAAIAEREEIDIRLYEVIYDALEDVKKAMEGMLAPTYKEKVVGRADVRQIFQVPKIGTICGCYVSYGIISRGNTRIHVLRNQVVVYDGKISSLRRFKDDVKEVATGFECGIGVERFNDVKVGDLLEVYIQEEVATVLS